VKPDLSCRAITIRVCNSKSTIATSVGHALS